jgi:Na+/melibiose symporter-like transporter
MDRTRTRLGRYRAWLIAGAPLLMIPVFMLFLPPGLPQDRFGQYAYLLGWLFVYYLGSSVVLLSHAAWASVIAGQYHERSRVFGSIQVVSIVAATLVLIAPSLVGSHSGAGDVRAMGWFIFIVTPLGIALAALRTPETIVADSHAERFGLRDYWEMVSRPDMRRIIIADFCLALGPGWMSAIYLFYFHDARGFSWDAARYLLAIYIVAGVIGAAVLSWLAMRLGKHRTLMIASTGYSLGLASMAFLPKGLFLPVAFFMFIMGFLAAGFPLLDRAMVADVGDAVRLQQGKHRVGLLYAMITSTQKIAGALSIGLTFTLLGLIGYKADEHAANTAAAIAGMQLVYVIGPIVFVMLGGACFIGYKLDARRHADIRAQLEARDAELTQAPVLEGLTGDLGVAGRIAPGE